MLISIIIPTYNSEKYIRRTLESLRSQIYKKIEVIIVDGLSNDTTLNIVNEFHDIVNSIISEKDNGMYDAINKGLKIAKGDIITYLNSDDYYHITTLQNVNNYFILNKEISIVYGTLFYVNQSDQIIKKIKSVSFNQKVLLSLWFCYIPQPCSFFRREVIKSIGEFNTQYKLASDFDFFLKASMIFKISLDKKIFSYHRRHTDSLTTKFTNTNRIETDSIRANYKPYITGFYNRTIYIFYYFLSKFIS